MHSVVDALNLPLQTPVPLTYPVFDTRRAISFAFTCYFLFFVPFRINETTPEPLQRDDKLVDNCFAIHLSVRCYH